MPDTSSCNVVAVFEDYATAERAMRDLSNHGFAQDAVQIRSNFMTGAAGRSGAGYSEHEGGKQSWWSRLFGGSDAAEDEQSHYAEAVRRGDAVLCVSASGEQTERAVEILNQHHPIDIDDRVSHFRETGYKGFDASAPAYTADEVARERSQWQGRERDSIPVVEEELEVGKRSVVRGGVRVYSRVVNEPVEEQVRLREEHIRVERRPADRPLSPPDVADLKDRTIEMTETAEKPIVSKRARVKEEVVLGKDSTERTETIRENLRHTEVDVERMAGDDEGYRNDFHRDFETRYARGGQNWESYEPAYMYGYRMGGDPRYKGKSWDQVESELRSSYERDYPKSRWDQMRDAVRYGWDKVTRRH
ncbi:MAG TPA: YsnF/AvaK domain-containing protein [Bryobacteraceae bacterium]|nr:YsnF/AvaK domain-containing protein [Bryobacteraceae bacterium]